MIILLHKVSCKGFLLIGSAPTGFIPISLIICPTISVHTG